MTARLAPDRVVDPPAVARPADADVAAFGDEHAAVYEETYRARGKDWPAEAVAVARIVRERRPDATSLLDVACGTGAHLATFASEFAHVEGLERSPAMRALAARRLPGVRLHAGDMREIALPRSFDAVTCLFTAIAYLPTADDLRRAVGSMADHLLPGGVLAIEPWWFPERFLRHHVGSDLVTTPTRTIARVSHTTGDDRHARMEAEWVVGEPGRGLRTFREVQVFTMFTREELADAVNAAGCTVEVIDPWSTGRALVVGVRVA